MSERDIPSFKVYDGEDFESYILRVCSDKIKYELTWKNIANIINYEWFHCETFYSPDFYRKKFYALKDKISYEEDAADELQDTIDEKKEKVSLSDMLIQTNANIRALSREDTIKELGVIAASIIAKEKSFITSSHVPSFNFEKAAILQISDWHYGIEIDNPYNKYNPEVARYRINNLIDQVITLCKEQKVNKLYVVNLGDMIAGRIHLPIRLNSRVDVITQIMSVSEIIAEAIWKLSCRCENIGCIEYYSVLDNHSRLDPNKKEALQLESLARITDWFLKERFKDHKDIIIHVNDKWKDIVTFNIFNYKFAGIHGDLDSQNRVVENVSLLTKTHYDVILSSHLHHWSLNEETQTAVISNPSLMGTDDLAMKLRKNSYPAQNLIIVTKNNPVYMLCRILVS